MALFCFRVRGSLGVLLSSGPCMPFTASFWFRVLMWVGETFERVNHCTVSCNFIA